MFNICLSKLIILLGLNSIIESKIEPRIVEGADADIKDFPHSAFLYISCNKKKGLQRSGWVCGASILNQDILLTAAHCLHGCITGSQVIASVGHRNNNFGKTVICESYIVHHKFNQKTVASDIALLKLKTRLKFSDKVKRIALMKKPLYSPKAVIAGWGYIDEIREITTDILQYLEQRIWKRTDCKKKIPNLPEGVLCASADKESRYSSKGDSGSALISHGHIEIGLVSFKVLAYRHLIVYTDTSYYYHWIMTRAKEMYCSSSAEYVKKGFMSLTSDIHSNAN